MTRDDIIKMAREAGLVYGSDEKPLGSVIRFAALVAEHEREACAELCVKLAVGGGFAADCSAAIRARGNHVGNG